MPLRIAGGAEEGIQDDYRGRGPLPQGRRYEAR